MKIKCEECGGMGDKVMPRYDGKADYKSEVCEYCNGTGEVWQCSICGCDTLDEDSGECENCHGDLDAMKR